MKQQFLIDNTGTFKTYVMEGNRKLIPDSAALTVYKPGTSDKLIDAAVMDVAADGLLSYALITTHNADVGEGYKASVSYVYSSVTYTFTLFYDVVRSIPHIVITDEDIENELPQLKEKNERVYGTADSGTITTIVDSELKHYADDYFKGGRARSLLQNETRDITAFTSSSGTVAVANAFSAAIVADKYVLSRAFTNEIQRSWEKIERWLKSRGKMIHLVLDPYDLRDVHIYAAVSEVCKSFANDESGFWWAMWKEYEGKATEAFASVNLKYDTSGDGYINGDERSQRVGSIKVRF